MFIGLLTAFILGATINPEVSIFYQLMFLSNYGTYISTF